MEERFLTKKTLEQFEQHLISDEKSKNTVEKYMRDVKMFYSFSEGREITKELAIAYKQKLVEAGYAVQSVNSMLASMNSLFSFLRRYDCKVKALKHQRQIFCSEDKELTKAEYIRLLSSAKQKKNERLNLIIQTICGTGIRVSELHFITVEAAKTGGATVCCKGKIRTVLIVKELKKKLLQYAKKQHITTGLIFVTRNGKPISRSNIWREMKALCDDANVNPSKVFPHNLRHLFARTFYAVEKDIARLADILGHSSINTTRIYIISTGNEHRKRMENMRLIV
ncbi:MAG: tyrosine-type recombinase/integrase [Oscillospiraceae bacterium]|nr:tyrosine-type recombinase/integrase [Oscillospiraceae bacterium]